MKWFLFLALVLATFSACNDDNTSENSEQQITCEVTTPGDGAQIDLGAGKMTISGNAEVDFGEIVRVSLTVGGQQVADVTEVPFSYEYTFSVDQEEGELSIQLEVEGDTGVTASDKVTVVLKKGETPEQQVSCQIVEPAEGTTIENNQTLTIKGEATVNTGEIAQVVLTVGGRNIAGVTAVPFEYVHTFTDEPVGELTIQLSVEGDAGATASDEVVITLKEPAPAPAEGTMIDSRDNHVYKTVKIGDQEWMAENLAWLPVVNNSTESSLNEGSEGKKFYYVFMYDGNDVEAAKATKAYTKYGVLYNWFAAMDAENFAGADAAAIPSGVQGVCPDGWHIPSQAEWKKMEAFVAAELPDVQGNGFYNEFDGVWEFEDGLRNVWSALAGLEGWGDSSMASENPDLANGPRDTYGFNAIPSGNFYPNGPDLGSRFKFSDSAVSYWTTDLLSYGGGIVTLNNMEYGIDYSKWGNQSERGQSVRCVKD